MPALAIAALAGLATMLMVGRFRDEAAAPSEAGCIIEGADLVGGPISLSDTLNQPVTQADFAGEPAVVYFGFTNCPDACPTAMYLLAEALKLPGGYDAQPILITVDPERDTPEVLGRYIHTDGFPDGLDGLTGTPEQIDAAAAAFRVVHQKSPIEGAPANVYNVDHTSFLYVLDGEWRTRAIITTQGRTPQEIAACIDRGLGGGRT